MDQYRNPHEEKFTVDEVLGWFRENDIEYINSVPKTALFERLTMRERIFEKHDPGTKLDHLLRQLDWVFTKGKEGGFFILIGRKRGALTELSRGAAGSRGYAGGQGVAVAAPDRPLQGYVDHAARPSGSATERLAERLSVAGAKFTIASELVQFFGSSGSRRERRTLRKVHDFSRATLNPPHCQGAGRP